MLREYAYYVSCSYEQLFLCGIFYASSDVLDAEIISKCYNRPGYPTAQRRRGVSETRLTAVYDNPPSVAQGNHAEVEPLYQRSLTIREKALGLEHPDVATVLNNLARLFESQVRLWWEKIPVLNSVK